MHCSTDIIWQIIINLRFNKRHEFCQTKICLASIICLQFSSYFSPHCPLGKGDPICIPSQSYLSLGFGGFPFHLGVFVGAVWFASWSPLSDLTVGIPLMMLKVDSAILGRNINYPIHLIFPHDPLAARLISRPSKKRWYNLQVECKYGK